MPQLADITVKKADGVTNVTFTAITGSAGDKSPAVWKSKSVGLTPAQNPSFTLVGADNGTGTSRRMKFSYARPTVRQDAGGNVVVDGRASAEGSFLLPQNLPDDVIAEIVADVTGLLHSQLVRDSVTSGYAPR